mmetsp:Transcript_110147/g.179705  ORF Transcript_110147/g.179705 Transcript_110147/m.179705 type:complete len:90 (+) Transcript_110147:213-482(+)
MLLLHHKPCSSKRVYRERLGKYGCPSIKLFSGIGSSSRRKIIHAALSSTVQVVRNGMRSTISCPSRQLSHEQQSAQTNRSRQVNPKRAN